MIDRFNKFKSLNYMEILIILFPLSYLFRSAILNFFIILFSIIFLFNLKKHVKFLKNEIWILFYLTFLFYLIFNSFFAVDFNSSLVSSLSQVRYLLFSLFILIAIKNINKFETIIFFHSMILILVSADTLFQFINNGVDILGFYVPQNLNRLSGPFGDELIVGTYITYLSIPIISYSIFNFRDFQFKMKIYWIFFIFIVFLSVLLSGERMSSLILISSFILILLLSLPLKKSLLYIIIFLISIFLSYSNINQVKVRTNDFISEIKLYKYNNHIRLFSSAYKIWETNKVNGVGLKNFRSACDEKKFDDFTKTEMLCSSHPHNIYFELLSETGLIGILLFLLFILSFFINYLRIPIKDKSIEYSILIGSLLVIFSYLWPVKSSGSFFSTFTASFFWINIGYLLMLKRISQNKKN